ncbi:hypothetical protein Tco_1487073 [Tanacetum coccineum]
MKWPYSQIVEEEKKLALVLDESCVNQRDFSLYLMGKVKEFGKVFWVRGKEVFVWVPDFVKEDEEENEIDDGIIEHGLNEENVKLHKNITLEGDSDDEVISEAIFEKEHLESNKKDVQNVGQDDTCFEDLFNIYELLQKKQYNSNGGSLPDENLKYPLGFTPMDATKVNSNAFNESKGEGDECLQRMQGEDVVSDVRKFFSMNGSKEDIERSILQLMDDLVKVGQTMGYDMEGYMKNI